MNKNCAGYFRLLRHRQVRAKKQYIHQLFETLKRMGSKYWINFFAFCFLTACHKSGFRLFSAKTFLLGLNGKIYDIRIGKGEFEFLYETNIRRVYESVPGFAPDPDDVAVDVGANIGTASIHWSRTLTEGAIFAIEPHPDTFRRLVKNIRLNHADRVIKPFHAALGRKKGMLPLFITDAGTMAIKAPSAKYGGNKIEVPCLTLDSFVKMQKIRQIDLLKIDVEGFESDVLQGASRSLQATRKIVLEYHSAALKDRCAVLLADAGFDLTIKENLIFGHKS